MTIKESIKKKKKEFNDLVLDATYKAQNLMIQENLTI